jgi:glycyl-tRNA synthetase beta chain
MAELILEILSEEIPARMQARAAADLQRLVSAGLKDGGLTFDGAETHVTPRRLVLVVDGLPEAQPDVSEERRGPNVEAPEKAVQGFLGSVGLTLDQVEKRETKKGTFLFAVIERKGQRTLQVLPGIIEGALAALPWPKSMRWGAHAARWVRPLHGLLCLFDGSVVPVTLGPVSSGNATAGHRFMAPAPFTVSGFADYKAKLAAAKVMLDAAERRALIKEQAEKLARSEGLTLKADQGLLGEVAGLVEWPVVLMGRIDEAFMTVPPEVLTTAMRSHQKYFSVLDEDGKLAPRFVVVANMETADGGAQIVAGNERVLRARLSDARFFWDQDCKASLESRVPGLRDRIFHARLGSDFEKVQRLRKLAVELAKFIPGADGALAERAALLCKADLPSEMVGEFPDLQGVMGRYYATKDGEDPAVAQAVAEHYSPQGPGDTCPTAPISVAVALADKIDSLAGFFAIEEKPTGSKDPFALRRAALGVIRLIIENGLRLPLTQVFAAAGNLHEAADLADASSVSEQLLDFFADRLKVHLKEEGVRHDLVSAVFALGGEDDLVRLLARVEALREFLGTEDGSNLLTAYKRASNIVRIEEKKDGKSFDSEADSSILAQDEEKDLHRQLEAVKPLIAEELNQERFNEAMAILAGLRSPVDAFFDQVTVNCDDPQLRENRLRLLSRIRSALGGVADFSRVEG